ncbi:MAG: integrase [Nitrososphaerota archaeon]
MNPRPPACKNLFFNIENYRRFLLSRFSGKYADDIFRLSLRYGKILFDGDVSELLTLGDDKRCRVMRALANLSKFLGKYDEWRRMREKYSLKWSNGRVSFSVFISQSFPNLVEECRKIISVLGRRFHHEVRFIACSGLRPSEALTSIKLFHEYGEKYLNKELMILEHYRFPETFIRRTKHAYITVLDDQLLSDLEKSEPASYNALRCFTKRRNASMKLNYFRKLYASYMRERGVLPEIIDLLQGRIPKNMFVRNYFRPDFNKNIEEVRSCLEGFRKLLFMDA